jgi:Cu+-exporting ATPase
MAIDSVCGMTVDPKTAAGSATWQGQTYFFCSPPCLAKFNADPAKYAGDGRGGSGHRLALATAHGALDQPGPPLQAVARSTKDLAKDPIRGMVVDKSTALKSERGGRAYYFCSLGCQRTFDSPEAWLMHRTRGPRDDLHGHTR